jgi:hypothetical protein
MFFFAGIALFNIVSVLVQSHCNINQLYNESNCQIKARSILDEVIFKFT